MLFDDDVVADGQAKSGALSGWFGREEGIEYFVPYFRWNTGAIVANSDLYAVAEVLRRCSQRRLAVASVRLSFALRGCVERSRSD